jgi:hypothetical protein
MNDDRAGKFNRAVARLLRWERVSENHGSSLLGVREGRKQGFLLVKNTACPRTAP